LPLDIQYRIYCGHPRDIITIPVARMTTVANTASADTRYDQTLAPVRALLRDPTVAPVEVGQAAVRALYPALLRAGGRASGLYGRGVVLVDLRSEAEAAVSYRPSDNVSGQ